ncbi:MAG: hypothetical protein U9Q81_04610 [Pseudomonadota bacterium]|nr:hypothetical protein [Pseudomonadota bacterium]
MAERNREFRLFVKSGNAMRMFLINSTIFMMIGIWLTGFDQAHWFSYVLPGIFMLSATFGICPGINLWRMLLGEEK